jgi:WD40 repeat protein
MLLVVTDGAIAWDSAAMDFDWERTTCLPSELRGRFREEPHFVDLRWARNRRDLSLRNAAFRASVLMLAAPLRGVPMDQLDGDDIRQRRWLRITVSSSAAILGLTIIASIAEWRSAQDQMKEAESRSMAAKSIEFLGQKGGTDKAALLAVLAWRLSPTDDARLALEKLGKASPDLVGILGLPTVEGIDSMALGPTADGTSLLATAGADGSVLLWHVPELTPARAPIAGDGTRIYEIQFSGSGTRLLTQNWNTGNRDEDIPSYDIVVFRDLDSSTSKLAPTNLLRQRNGLPNDLEHAASLSPDGELVAFFVDNEIAIWNPTTDSLRRRRFPSQLIGVHFTTNSRLVFVLEDDVAHRKHHEAGFWDLTSDAIRTGPPVAADVIGYGNSRAVFSEDGSGIVVMNSNDRLFIYRSPDGLNLQLVQVPGIESLKADMRFSVALEANGRRVAVGAEDRVVALDLVEQKLLKKFKMDFGHRTVAMSRDGRWLASTDHGKVVLWNLDLHDSEASAKTLDAACSLSGSHQRECIRRLCEKISPLINDRVLNEALGNYNYEKLKQTALGRPCPL